MRVRLWIPALLLICYVAFLAWRSPTAFPTSVTFSSHMPYLMDKPVGEDGYYMLTVADNIATKGRILYNRGLEATGIQPLATVAFAGIDWVVKEAGGNGIDLIRWVLFTGGLLFVLFAFQMAALVRAMVPEERKATAFTLGFLLVLTDYTLFRLFTYGLETGFYLVCLAVCAASTWRIARERQTSYREALILGAAAGFAGEARIDFGVLFGALLVLMLLRRWMSVEKAAVSGLVALVIVSPWFWFVHRVTGSWIPSSGKAESTLVTVATVLPRLKTMLINIGGHVAPWSYGGMSRATTAVTVVSVAGLAWLFGSAAGRRARASAPVAFRMAGLWGWPLAGLLAIYVVFFNSIHFYYRYSAPLVVVTIPLVAIALTELNWVRTHMVAVEAMLLLLFAGWTAGSLHTGHIGNSQTVAAGYVHTYYPQAHVGAFQSGVVGYFNRNVENLDGKLNLPAWNASRQHRLPEFIDQDGIDVLVDWPSVIALNLPQKYLAQEWEPCPVPLTGTESICLIRRSVAGTR